MKYEARRGSLALAKRLISREVVHDDKWNKKLKILDYFLNEVNRGAQWLMSPGRAVEGRIGREPYQKIIASMSPDRAAAKTHFTKENFHHNPYRIVLINQGILL